IENGNEVYLKYASPLDAPDAASDRTATTNITVTIDPDGTGAAPAVTLAVAVAVVELFEELTLVTIPATPSATVPLVSDGSADNPYAFQLRSNSAVNSQVGVIGIDGARAESAADAGDEEIIDVISSDSSLFSAMPRKANG
ncbi:MAG: hypothetical protein J4F45_15115, partial [Pseudomonadales bacterium]|nr:hypothetical protein [Pseudomonadales bacterium]